MGFGGIFPYANSAVLAASAKTSFRSSGRREGGREGERGEREREVENEREETESNNMTSKHIYSSWLQRCSVLPISAETCRWAHTTCERRTPNAKQSCVKRMFPAGVPSAATACQRDGPIRIHVGDQGSPTYGTKICTSPQV